MPDLNFKNISIDELPIPAAAETNIKASLLRLDKIHADISGNKWFKLKYYIEDAITMHKSTVLTFGGAWSNHVIATAAVCQARGLQSIAIIRGEEPAPLSYTLKTAKAYGMRLIFISRQDYQHKIIPPFGSIATDDLYIINEGGYGEMGATGAAEIAHLYEREEFTHICCAVGTGTMMAGLLKTALPKQPVIGISVLKNNPELNTAIRALLTREEREKPGEIIHSYHFGGYAKYTPILTHFMNEFYRQTSVPTDFVYTGKLLFGIYDLARKNYFPEGSRLLLIHSGGLQGNNSLADDTLIF